jgi:isopenicillin-N epimerase
MGLAQIVGHPLQASGRARDRIADIGQPKLPARQKRASSLIPDIRDLFLLDPEVVFLNHGSFGACPRPVFEAYQTWQRLLEQQPVRFLGREYLDHDLRARQALAEYLHVETSNLVFVTNATQGVNIIARSLDLKPGDEILTSDHEYGACDRAWNFICDKRGARYIHRSISLPISAPLEAVDQFLQGVTPNTKLIFLSHVTSPTAQRLPIEAICSQARQAGILTLIDGAHAPGQIPLNLPEIGADFYTGNCHKWMLSPKGAAFLYARPETQDLVEPLVVSWGWGENPTITTGSRFVDYQVWSGTHDPSAALAVPDAIDFMQKYNWDIVRQECHDLLLTALARVSALSGLPSPYSDDPDFRNPVGPHPLPPQMGIAPLPPISDLEGLKKRLYEQFRIEVPLIEWDGAQYVRISIQAYNTLEDIDALVGGLATLLLQYQR